MQDVLAAATRLDDAGFRGPYALALAPALYNNLFRLFPGTDVIGLEHLRRLCTAGIYKAPIEGGVLVDTRVGVLVLGQDFSAGYSSQDGVHYHLYVSESIVLRIDEPKAICVITPPASSTGAMPVKSGHRSADASTERPGLGGVGASCRDGRSVRRPQRIDVLCFDAVDQRRVVLSDAPGGRVSKDSRQAALQRSAAVVARLTRTPGGGDEAADLGGEQPGELDRRRVLALRPDDLQSRPASRPRSGRSAPRSPAGRTGWRARPRTAGRRTAPACR